MEKFRYVDDVENWLKPMGYEEFWNKIKPHCLVLEHRWICDAQIEAGEVAQDVVLDALKIMACHELSKRHKLWLKPATPWLTVVSAKD